MERTQRLALCHDVVMSDASHYSATKVGPPLPFHGLLWVGFPLLGALAGWLLALALDWIVGLSWAPFQGPLNLLDEVTGAWTTPVLIAIGAVAGIVVALVAYGEIAFVTVDPETVTITLDNKSSHIARADAAAVFVEGKHLVIQDRSGRQHARAPISDLPADKLKGAFTTHGYPWVGSDPFEAAFVRWVPDAPALPAGASAILAARQKALEKGNKDDLEDFRHELDRVGVVVREDGKRQFWRSIV